MNIIKVLIVDDEKLIREGLKIILSTHEDIDVVGMCSNGQEALEFIRKNRVDIILMDIRMPICDGVLGTRIIKEEFEDIKVLILTTFDDREYIHEALKYGASGYLLKDSSYDLIYEGIKVAVKGSLVVHPKVANTIISSVSKEEDYSKEIEKYCLTDRELTIIKEIANGLSNREIAEKLYLSEGTIKNNISNILTKLDLRDRTQIAIFAFKIGLAK
ncbi:response regulator transcription factor [Tepidimicrobium xylanilyticum]|uniref:Two component transcriptional regulator, LuxR family n=1 Tax=Tepidimicrobium xylanilyticum TaxID=1123352 RepID=A0A1H2Q680_9FIRM|nr:response regulator transcription factor [Tepidimicrobium xylanilyticum]GMG95739.1 DNA-binding response regulator [Tepidimicrobium xylanilyticum]SDW02625.1 two component transcriptional regulator, LuxR family [Tepidimicrobium xylanilyticum]